MMGMGPAFIGIVAGAYLSTAPPSKHQPEILQLSDRMVYLIALERAKEVAFCRQSPESCGEDLRFDAELYHYHWSRDKWSGSRFGVDLFPANMTANDSQVNP